MALSTSSRFERVYIQISIFTGIPAALGYVTDEDTPESGSITLHNNQKSALPASGTDDATNLGILQEIYASGDGFQDADDNDVIVGIGGNIYPGISSVEDLEDNGLFNPLIVGSFERIAEGHKMRALLNRGMVEEQYGVEYWDMATGAKFPNVHPTENIDINLGEAWRVTQEEDDRFLMSLDFTQLDDILTVADFVSDVRLIVLYTWLRDKKIAGPNFSFPADATTLADLLNVFGASNFSDVHDGVTTIFQDSANFVSIDYKPDGTAYYSAYNMRFFKQNDGDFDIDNFTALLDARTYSVTPLAATRVPNILEAAGLSMGRASITTVGNTIAIRITDNDGRKYVVPLTGRFGIAHPWSSTDNTFPAERVIDTIHFNSPTNGVLSFLAPVRYVMNNGEYRIFSVHNTGGHGDGYCDVQDGNGDPLIFVYPGEEIEFRVGVDHSGHQEVVVVNPPPRNEIRDWGYLGTLSNRGYWGASGGGGGLLLAIPQGGVEVLDTDMFEVGTGTRTDMSNSDAVTDASEADVFTQDAIKVKRAGQMTVRESITIEATGQTPFGWGDGHRLELWRRRNGVNEEIHADGNHQYFGGTSGTENYRISTRLPVEAEDIYWFGIHLEGTGNPNISRCRMQSGSRSFILEAARIREEYVAP